MRYRSREKGVGIIEVLIALVVLMLSALTFSNIQTSALINMSMTDTRFKVNEHALDMLEQLRANASGANAGTYDFDYDDSVDVVAGALPVLSSIRDWKSDIASHFNQGRGKIDCDNVKCLISIRWQEPVNGTWTNQTFDLAGLL